ncbi:MAG: SMI1/KNR4 family protein [Pseudomonadota bacterium]
MDDNLRARLDRLKPRFSRIFKSHLSPKNQDFPYDYVAFLKHIGYGTIGDGFFEIYKQPLPAEHIYGSDCSERLKSIKLFGDDYNGYCVGFDSLDEWAVVEVDKITYEVERLADNFIDFMETDFRVNPQVD